jgi:hypothetical protein
MNERRPLRGRVATATLVALLAALAACSSPGVPSTRGTTAPTSSRGSTPTSSATGGGTRAGDPSPSSSPAAQLTVTSSLDGHTALPHRIDWTASPSPATDVEEVDFLIDGTKDWVEQNAPYDYGDDGNYLVTSFLKPGPHEFTVTAVDFDGQTAMDSVTASVPKAPAPPGELAGTWKGWRPAGGAPAGDWRLVVDEVGWRIYQPDVGANLIDAAYPAPGMVEIRTGMATGQDHVVGVSPERDLNGWCNDAPGSPARYRWAVRGAHLHLTFMSGNPCSGFTKFLQSSWARAA